MLPMLPMLPTKIRRPFVWSMGAGHSFQAFTNG
jgi:hypothetical protein